MISFEEAALLFNKWKAERTPIGVLFSRTPTLCFSLRRGFVEEVSDFLVKIEGEQGAFFFAFLGAEITYSEPRELPEGAFGAEGPKFDKCLRFSLPNGETCLFFELVK